MRPDAVDEIILEGEERQTEAVITVQLQNIGDVVEEVRQLRLRWDTSSAPELPLGVGIKTITEWAACALASIVVSHYMGLRMRAVATEGDRFDYWCRIQNMDFGLEVSGTQVLDEAELTTRQRQKVRQLLSNPYGINGFVIVTSFATNIVRFSYHRLDEGE
jgi:hypothetical protein